MAYKSRGTWYVSFDLTSAKRLLRASAQRRSIANVRPSIQPSWPSRCSRAVPAALGIKALFQASEINHHPLVGTSADLLDFISRDHRKDDPTAINLCDFRLRRHPLSDRRRRDMTDVNRRTDGAFTMPEIAANGVERGILHRQDHNRCRQHWGQQRVLEPVRQVFGRDNEVEAPLRPYWDFRHA